MQLLDLRYMYIFPLKLKILVGHSTLVFNGSRRGMGLDHTLGSRQWKTFVWNEISGRCKDIEA